MNGDITLTDIRRHVMNKLRPYNDCSICAFAKMGTHQISTMKG